uniref:Glycoprotein endo-alpha-1,2-mannosidase n=1 Tax=Phallusia mammillata TaxID=59560 RepID=A0A6F9DKP6_9ASCI|nr:glycoprotein endo-alpha-1,2-mannosidase [Phallusia mammillata]
MFRMFIRRRRICALALTIVCFGFALYYHSFKQRIQVKESAQNIIPLTKYVEKELISASNVSHVGDQKRDQRIPMQTVPPNPFKKSNPSVNYNVHAFYYTWYGNPKNDGKYLHWNHRLLPHWEKRVSNMYATGQRHQPPDDIGANFYPVLGAYSSLDPEVITTHMHQIKQSGIGVLALSWYPAQKADDEGKPADQYVSILLSKAAEHNIKICFHIEPYKGRTAQSVGDDIKYINNKYGNHPAFYKTNHPHKPDKSNLPLIYIYDSYQILPDDWKILLGEDGSTSIRGTKNDAIVIGLLVEKKHSEDILTGGFDGFYTYFASSGFSYGSNLMHWRDLNAFATQHQLLFIPSVGPGYIDTNVRPWNGGNTKHRDNGAYYENEWQSALQVQPNFVSITSFNEWHEGTQIEPALSQKTVSVEFLHGKRQRGTFLYLSYGNDPNLYLDLTKTWVEQFEKLSGNQ